MRDSFHRVVIVWSAGREAQFQINMMCGGHGGGYGVEVNGPEPGFGGTVEHGLGESSAQSQSPGDRPDPEPFQLAGTGRTCGRQSAPCHEACRMAINEGQQAAASLFLVAERQAFGFFLKRTKTETRSPGLGDDEATVFEQELLRLHQSLFRGGCGDFFKVNGSGCGSMSGHA